LNDVPSPEYAVWYPDATGSKNGYWLKHIAVKEMRMLWGDVSPGVDLNVTSRYLLRALTRKDVTGYDDQPFAPQRENHVWKIEGDTLHGFQFDEKGHLLYVIDGVPGAYSLDDVPYSGEYGVWYPRTPTSQQGYWLTYSAVKSINTDDITAAPGLDYTYQVSSPGKSIANLSESSRFTSDPFAELPLEPHIWKKKGDELYGAQFNEKGHLLYLIHGIPGTYSLNDVPLSGEYVVWFPLAPKTDEGFWLKYVAVAECEMEWGAVTYGVDLYYYQKEGHGISWLTRDHYYEGWDLEKFLKYLWDLFNSD
jgi:hypothetical protein